MANNMTAGRAPRLPGVFPNLLLCSNPLAAPNTPGPEASKTTSHDAAEAADAPSSHAPTVTRTSGCPECRSNMSQRNNRASRRAPTVGMSDTAPTALVAQEPARPKVPTREKIRLLHDESVYHLLGAPSV